MQPSEAHRELNPFEIEHRLSLVEERERVGTLRTQEQIGNTSLAVEKLAKAIEKMGEQHARRATTLQDQIDEINDAREEQAKMATSHALGYKEGQNSINVKIPGRQMVAFFTGMTALIIAAESLIQAFR